MVPPIILPTDSPSSTVSPADSPSSTVLPTDSPSYTIPPTDSQSYTVPLTDPSSSTLPPTDSPSSTPPPTVPSTSTTPDATSLPNTTAPPTPSSQSIGLQKGSLAISVVAILITVYLIVKALVMLPVKLLSTRYARVKEFQENIVNVMKGYEDRYSVNLGISRRALELAQRCVIQITATWSAIDTSTFPYYNRRVHTLMMGVFKCMWEFHNELQASDGILRLTASYAEQWQTVIERARRLFRVYMAGRDGFPDAVSGLEVARKCLDHALFLHLEGGGVVEPTQHIDESMKRLVYAESWRFRHTLKDAIAKEVKGLRPLFPNELTGSDQEAQQIGNTIKLWTDHGSYLYDSVPDMDTQVHFAHPIIVSTVRSFYRGKWTDVSTHGQYMAKGVVPKPLVALVSSVYRNALDEWLSGRHAAVALEREVYKPVYDGILRGITLVDDHPVDGPALRARLTNWAQPEVPTAGYVAPIPTDIILQLSPL